MKDREINKIKIYYVEKGFSYKELQKIQHYRIWIIYHVLKDQREEITPKEIQKLCSVISKKFSETIQRIIAPALYSTGIHYHIKMDNEHLWITEERNSWNESNFYKWDFNSHAIIKENIKQ